MRVSTALLALFILSTLSVTAQVDSASELPYDPSVIMYIGHLNPDCVVDTLIGEFQDNLQVHPEFICWGRLYDDQGTSLCQTGKFDARIKESKHRDTTWIEKPTWDDLRLTVSVHQYNTNDSLADLIFWTRGSALAKVTRSGKELIDSVESGSNDSVFRVDTARAIVVFGHVDLSSRKTLDITKVKASQSSPYAAMELGYSRDLVRPRKRDNTQKTSWKLKKINREVDSAKTSDTTSAPPPMTASATTEPVTVQIYPNPAIYSTSIVLEPVPAGEYTVEVISANGQTVDLYELSLSRAGHVLETLDLSTLPSGHYFVRVRSNRETYGDYPVIIVR